MPTRRELANAIRVLSMDAVQQANSGHPGMPMGMADIAEVLWNDYLKHNPANPQWPNRDRFVVSNGHGSMLLYSLLHLTGYDLPMDELRNFRQMHSKTPGHPEVDITPGVETTTGPLGQGLSNAVGMALAERILAAHFNCAGFDVVDHHTYVFLGDGCLMEGISHEACSLAGTLGLGKLICYYDDNNISIDGEVAGWFLDDTPMRFESYGWQVIRDVDGHDAEAIAKATRHAKAEAYKPTLICCKTVIGKGAPNKEGTEGVHGAPLGDEEIKASRESLGWSHGPFEIPPEINEGWDARKAGAEAEAEWQQLFDEYTEKHPELAAEFERRIKGILPTGWAEACQDFIAAIQAEGKNDATRKSSRNALNVFAPQLPELIGGSADLSESNCTNFEGHRTIKPGQFDGNYIFYGVREFGMTAIMNGLALHGGFIPFGGTFLTFSDYARNAVRMAALMKRQAIMVYTHDSIGLGEDGPTHQSVEHIASLRIIPNMTLWRPCDDVETAAAWQAAIEHRSGPTALALSRQGLPHQERDADQLANIRRGGYILWQPEACNKGEQPDAILIGTGSEVALVMETAKAMEADGHKVRVVSMPCTQTFDQQDDDYKASVLPKDVIPRVAVEAGVIDGWYRYTGMRGRIIGMSSYGESAPAGEVFKHFGFTVDNIKSTAEALIQQYT